MNDLGSITLETQRLYLRKVTIDDVDQMYEHWAKDEEVSQYVSYATHQSKEDTKKIIRQWIKEYEEPFCFNWFLVLKDSNEVIGQISVVEKKLTHRVCEVGYTLGKKWWNQGYMSEALKTVLQFLLDDVGFECVEAKHASDNPTSGKVMHKAGMKYDTTLPGRRVSKMTDERVDLVVYSILRNKHRNVGWKNHD